MSTPNDYKIYAPQSDHQMIMEALDDYRCWQEQSDEDDLWIQGHPGMFEVIKEKFDYPFMETFIGSNYDLMVSYKKVNDEWQEELELYWHGWGPEYSKIITVDEFNDALDARYDDEDERFAP